MFTTPFRFRLERVRALRERKEELARTELAMAMGRLSASEHRLRATNARLAQAHQEQRSTTGGSVSAADLVARQAFLEHVEHQQGLGLQETRRSAGEVANRGAELGRAAQEHEMLERLKARKHREHLHEEARREGAALDELAINRHRPRAT